ncbi:MAG: hypothetical protein AB7D51_07475 [Desulfovibrionaceae bacterium]
MEVCGQRFVLRDVAAEAIVAMVYDVRGDSHFDVRATLAAGGELELSSGYVTHGFHFADVFRVHPQAIVHEPQSVPAVEQ